MKQWTEDITSILREEGAILAYLFGSYAQGTHNKHSDVDIAVLFEEDPSLPERVCIQGRLEDLVERDVDLVLLSTDNMVLRKQVLSKGKLILCTSEEKRIAFEKITRKKYMDLAYHRRIRAEKRRQRILNK